MASSSENKKRMKKIFRNGIDWKKDGDFIKMLRHSKRSDAYYEKLSASKSGPVITSYLNKSPIPNKKIDD
ncbi:hypothetical protein [Polynucleobacter sp.]|uniref:hypothetical protein n=1 Tax=Polynucleobacter sp. TaxID=2029855 RepID=UPI003F6A30DE